MPTLNLLADENVDQQIIDLLRREGHTVTYVAELDPGIDDEQVLERANEANALLLTADRDFGYTDDEVHRRAGTQLSCRPRPALSVWDQGDPCSTTSVSSRYDSSPGLTARFGADGSFRTMTWSVQSRRIEPMTRST